MREKESDTINREREALLAQLEHAVAQTEPEYESIRGGAQCALLNLEGVDEAEVELVWNPPWHPSMMTEFGRAATGVEHF